MSTIDKNSPPTDAEVKAFMESINFLLPQGFIEFYKETNGADIEGDETYAVIWPITDLLQLNKDYSVETYAPEFFIFGSDGGDTAYAIEKGTGYIFEFPFIGMSKDQAIFKNNNFNEFIALI